MQLKYPLQHGNMGELRKLVRKVQPVPVAEVKKTLKRKLEFPKDGQKKATPPANDPLRKYYTSLLKQKPSSELASKWCLEHGLFPGQKENIYCSMSKLTL